MFKKIYISFTRLYFLCVCVVGGDVYYVTSVFSQLFESASINTHTHTYIVTTFIEKKITTKKTLQVSFVI